MNMDLTIRELYRIFEFYNDKLYSCFLTRPVILIQTNGKNKSVLGWCTTKKIWTDKEGKESYYEITICAEYLNRSIEEIIGTLLHEMVHLYCLQKDIKDTSRSGTYHNKKFKQIAEDHGLIIEYDKRIGWSLTTLQGGTKHLIHELEPHKELFKVARRGGLRLDPADDEKTGEDPDDEKPKSSTRKYICPICGATVRATRDLTLSCYGEDTGPHKPALLVKEE